MANFFGKTVLAYLAFILLLFGCGDGGGGGEAGVATYSIGGTLTGLAGGNSIVLQNNGGDNVTLMSNGAFAFPTKLKNFDSYRTSILVLPSDQACTITHGEATVNGEDVTNVNVKCDPVFAASFTPTGSLATPRSNHAATLLPNGHVLVTGGNGAAGILSSAELYDPSTGLWSAAGDMAFARDSHTATLLPNGRVLIVGRAFGGALSNAELYDPVTHTWSAAGLMTEARYGHAATLLPSGKVLVTGGNDSGGNFLSSAELYDSAANTWSAAASLAIARGGHTATQLANGQVLVAGGVGTVGMGLILSAEIYHPDRDSWSSAGNLAINRIFHTATLLPNKMLAVIGGYNANGRTYQTLSSVELYNPETNSWASASNLNTTRETHTATLLPNGTLLVAGGVEISRSVQMPPPSRTLESGELFNPEINSWSATGSMTPRGSHTATLLLNGQVLVAGGINGSGFLSSAELFH